MKQKTPLPMTPFDMLVTTEELQMMKLFLPYLPASSQRMFAIFIKFTELKNTLDYFRGFSKDMDWPCNIQKPLTAMDMFEEIRPYIKEEEAGHLDMVLSAMSMMDMMNAQNSSDSKVNPIDFIKSMIPPDQQNLFDIYNETFQKGDPSHEPKQQSMDTMDESSANEKSGSYQAGTD